MRPIVWVLALAGLLIWSVFAWFAYEAVEGMTGWVQANASLSLDGARALAAAGGVGKEATMVAETLSNGDPIGRGVDILRTIGRPAIVGIWAVGAVVLVVGPLVLPKMGGLLLHRRSFRSRH